jgi:phosphatidylglycerol:prolipoprotein diacylglycerol transferase
MLLYAISRFIIEIYRGDDRGMFFNNAVSTSQLVSIAVVPLSLFMLWRLSKRAS